MVNRNGWPFQFMRPSRIRNLILLPVLLALILLALMSTIANFIIEYKVAGGRTGWDVDQHAVVQQCPLRGGRPGGFHRIVGGSCAGAALRRRPQTGFPRVFPAG